MGKSQAHNVFCPLTSPLILILNLGLADRVESKSHLLTHEGTDLVNVFLTCEYKRIRGQVKTITYITM